MSNPLIITETTEQHAPGMSAAAQPSSVFDTVPDLMIYRSRWMQRCQVYQLRRAYYNGDVYRDPQLLRAMGLYNGVRGIFHPLRRAVRIDVARVPGAWSMPDDTTESHKTGITALRTMVHAATTYDRAILYGAIAGEFGMLMQDDRRNRAIHLIPLRPDEVVTGTRADGSPFGLVLKRGLVDRAGVYEYAQLITPGAISTYRNGALYDYDGGQPIRPNALGFIPLILSPYIAGENGTGECSFSGIEEQLNRVNDATSQALDVLQRNAEPLVVFSGVNEITQDPQSNAVLLSDDTAKGYTLSPNLVIDQALALIVEVKKEFKSGLPQLVLDEIITRNDLAYDTVLTLCGELIDHVISVRRHVDAAILQAERWAIMAGQQMQIPALMGIDPAAHKLDPDRAVIQPTPGQKIQIEQQKIALERAKKELENPQPREPRTIQLQRTPRRPE